LKPKYEEVSLSKIDISESNVRKSKITKEEFDSLVASIKTKGVLQPIILVRKGDRFELPVGQNRFLAAKEAGIEKIPALVYDELNPMDMRVISAIENLQRINLAPVDRAAAVHALFREFGSQKAVADALGFSQGWVSYELGIKGLPDGVQTMINDGKLTTHEASGLRHLTKWNPPEEVEKVAELVSAYSKKDAISREKRKTAVQIARTKPTITAEELRERVEKKIPVLKLNISISETELEALKRAANEEDEDLDDLAHRIINEWLVQNEYVLKG
jgi:ParB family chromosome partitioning protein